MILSSVPVLFAIFAFTSYVLADDSTPAVQLVSSAKLKPLISRPASSRSGTDALKTRTDNPLSGLLVRQTCPSGYGACTVPVGICCPLGGRCCLDRTCCSAGSFCVTGGCCLTSEFECENGCCPRSSSCCRGGGCCASGDYCAIDSAGNRGCCPIGEICSGTSDECSGSGFVKCPGENFCCPSGDACFRDSAGQGRCRSSGGGGGGPTSTTIRSTTTSTRTTSTITTTQITSTVVVPGPTQRSGSSVIQYRATDTQIVYQGEWQTTTSICNGQVQSKTAVSAFSSFTFQFTGSEIYLSLTTFNVFYTIRVGTESTTFGSSTSTRIPSNCTFSYGQTGLSTTQSTLVQVNLFGSSLVTNEEHWSFALEQLSVVTDGSSSSEDNPASTTSSSARPTFGAQLPDGAFSKFDLKATRVFAHLSVVIVFSLLMLGW